MSRRPGVVVVTGRRPGAGTAAGGDACRSLPQHRLAAVRAVSAGSRGSGESAAGAPRQQLGCSAARYLGVLACDIEPPPWRPCFHVVVVFGVATYS